LKLPFYKPARHSVALSLALIMILLLLMLTGLGVFRLYFDFDWIAGDASGQLFSLKIRGGQSMNLFDAPPVGRTFWLTQLSLLSLCILMPRFRVPGGSIIALLAATGIVLLHRYGQSGSNVTPLELELLIVLLLYFVYLLFSYIADVREQKRLSAVLAKFVPEELSQEYKGNSGAMSLTSEQREISVLFCDIRDFSAATQQLEPQQLTQWLNLFFNHVSRIVIRHRGSIDKYIGDSVMAVWGAPAITPTHAFDALNAAMDMQAELHVLNEKYRELKLPDVAMGVGICSGPAMVGPLGSDFRMDYTVVGDTVNIAQRLEAQTRKYQVPVIVADTTAEDLPDLLFRELDTVVVKGRDLPVTMLEPLGSQENASDALLEQLELHRQAMQSSKESDWDHAARLFSQLRDTWGPADMYDIYLRGIEQARKPG